MVSPTQFQDVNDLLNDLLERVQIILGHHFVGMYLFGSLTSGDFDEDSDIDVLVVTDNELTEDIFVALQTMHKNLATRPSVWAVQLEVSYIPQRDLRRYDPAHAEHPHLDRGPGESLHRKQHNSSWVVQRSVLRQRGIVVKGPALSSLIDPVSPDDLRRAMWMLIDEWGVKIFQDTAELRQRGGQSYIVLTICRMLYTLELGDVVSKAAAARWAQETLGPHWKQLIDRTWEGRHNPDLLAEADDIAGTLELLRHAVERSQALQTK